MNQTYLLMYKEKQSQLMHLFLRKKLDSSLLQICTHLMINFKLSSSRQIKYGEKRTIRLIQVTKLNKIRLIQSGEQSIIRSDLYLSQWAVKAQQKMNTSHQTKKMESYNLNKNCLLQGLTWQSHSLVCQ